MGGVKGIGTDESGLLEVQWIDPASFGRGNFAEDPGDCNNTGSYGSLGGRLSPEQVTTRAVARPLKALRVSHIRNCEGLL